MFQFPSALETADIPRLLDPSYSGCIQSATTIYVDANGDVHDPDYKPFPIVRPPKVKAPSSLPPWPLEFSDYSHVDEDDNGNLDVPILRFANRRPQVSRVHRSKRLALPQVSDSSPIGAQSSRESEAPKPTTRNWDIKEISRQGPRRIRPRPQASHALPTMEEVEDEGYNSISRRFPKISDIFFFPTSVRRSPGDPDRRPTNESDSPLLALPSFSPSDGTLDHMEPNEVWSPTGALALSQKWLAIRLRAKLALFRLYKRLTGAGWDSYPGSSHFSLPSWFAGSMPLNKRNI